jgi:hypothetical protein
MADVDVEEAADVCGGVEDVAELDVAMFGLADAAEVESEDDELDGSAHAIPWWVNRTAPTPSVSARPPMRPRYASPRTRQLYRRR